MRYTVLPRADKNVKQRIWIPDSTVAGQSVLGGGQLSRAKPTGVRGKKTLKIFEIFIPEIAANASNFKNYARIYGELICYYFFLFISP